MLQVYVTTAEMIHAQRVFDFGFTPIWTWLQCWKMS